MLEEKLEMYNYLLEKRPYFIAKANGKTKDEKYIDFFKENNIVLPIEPITEINVYDYLCNNKGKFCICGNNNTFYTISLGYSMFCSKKCLHKWRSDNMKGLNNHIYRATPETLKAMGKKNSIRIKQAIANGSFTPNVTNSWANSRCYVEITQNDVTKIIKCRSSWDAYFQIKNPEFIYEHIRVPYEINGVFHSYIVDFVDIKNRVLFEIKPIGLEDAPKNVAKFKAAISWCESNNYKFKIIDNSWFIQNYDANILINQPDENKIKKRLVQFVK